MVCSRRPLILASTAAVVAMSLLAAGCGGGGSPGVASVAYPTTTAQTGSGLVGYSSCMRSHGIANFPDPDSTGGIPKPQVVAAAQNNPSRFNAASSACQHLLPNGSLGPPPETAQQQATKLADGLSFATCMRNHGVARFPDPTPQGQLTLEMIQAQGIDLHSPAVLRTVDKCLPASHGLLTPAKVAQALHDASG